jgi:hypothetical protein
MRTGARRRKPFATAVGALTSAAIIGGCGISTDSAPRDLPEEERTIAISGPSAGAVATGADRIYLVGPGDDRLLRSVPRDAVPGLNLMEILLLGPNNAEIEAQYSTVIPSGTELLSTRSQGSFLFVDVSEEVTELTGPSLTQALAQLVYTATELEGIEAVQLTVNGEGLSWPTGDGSTTDAALRIYDYPSMVRTAQPDYPAVPAVG